MHIPSRLREAVRSGNRQCWAGELGFNPITILRRVDREYLHFLNRHRRIKVAAGIRALQPAGKILIGNETIDPTQLYDFGSAAWICRVKKVRYAKTTLSMLPCSDRHQSGIQPALHVCGVQRYIATCCNLCGAVTLFDQAGSESNQGRAQAPPVLPTRCRHFANQQNGLSRGCSTTL